MCRRLNRCSTKDSERSRRHNHRYNLKQQLQQLFNPQSHLWVQEEEEVMADHQVNHQAVVEEMEALQALRDPEEQQVHNHLSYRMV